MHRVTLNTLVGMLALTTSGSEPNKIKVNNNSPAAKVKIDKKSTLAIPPAPKNTEAQTPIKIASSADATELIKPTDGKQRAEQVLQGRSDPFSGLSTPIPVEPTPKPQKVFPNLPRLPVALELPPPPKQVKPEQPKTDLAKGIAVEGVMGIGNERHAIIKLPNDAGSRYVAEGQELLGGRVLVKAIKIDATNSDDPTVIFEQNGVEIAAAVGFKPDNKNNTGLTDNGSTVASTSSPMSILTADVAAKRVSSKPADEVAYRPPSSPVSSTSPDSQGRKDILPPSAPTDSCNNVAHPVTIQAIHLNKQIDRMGCATLLRDFVTLLPELRAHNTRGEQNQQPFNSKSISVALNELPRAKKLSAPQAVDLKPRLSSAERYKQLVYRLRYSREGLANNTLPGANTRVAQHPFEQPVSDSTTLGNNDENARATSSSQLNQEQKAKAYRQLVDRLRYGSNVDRQH